MAAITLSDAEANEVRFLLHSDVDADDISNAEIAYGTFLGAACNFVIESLLQASTFETRPTDADFMAALQPVQLEQFRRAVLNRTGGLIAHSISVRVREAAGTISEWYNEVDWKDKQLELFQRAEEEMAFVRRAFPVTVSPLLSTAFFITTG